MVSQNSYPKHDDYTFHATSTTSVTILLYLHGCLCLHQLRLSEPSWHVPRFRAHLGWLSNIVLPTMDSWHFFVVTNCWWMAIPIFANSSNPRRLGHRPLNSNAHTIPHHSLVCIFLNPEVPSRSTWSRIISVARYRHSSDPLALSHQHHNLNSIYAVPNSQSIQIQSTGRMLEGEKVATADCQERWLLLWMLS